MHPLLDCHLLTPLLLSVHLVTLRPKLIHTTSVMRSQYLYLQHAHQRRGPTTPVAGVAAVVLSDEAGVVLEHLAPAVVLFLGSMPAPELVHKGIVLPIACPHRSGQVFV